MHWTVCGSKTPAEQSPCKTVRVQWFNSTSNHYTCTCGNIKLLARNFQLEMASKITCGHSLQALPISTKLLVGNGFQNNFVATLYKHYLISLKTRAFVCRLTVSVYN